ncbi:MAG: hypothetical protein K0U74_00870 [Alphaproteobacteria bacterium]|nr:hypothetical protein [Alphaproteobacteria bacterium]
MFQVVTIVRHAPLSSLLKALYLQILQLVVDLALFRLKFRRQEVETGEYDPRECPGDKEKSKETWHLIWTAPSWVTVHPINWLQYGYF